MIKIKDAKEILLDPAKRKAYDATYNDILQAVVRLVAERRVAQGVDREGAIASHLRLHQPTTLDDGSPIRSHCIVQVSGLPPQATAVDLVRAIAELAPVGRVIKARLMKPNNISPDRAALVEFANDGQAQHFGLLASRHRFYVLRKKVWHCKLLPLSEQNLQPPPPEATRVLVIDGPRHHRLMTASAMGDFFGSMMPSFDTKHDRCSVMDSAKGPDSVTIEWAFTSWRGGSGLAYAALRQEYPELTVMHGEDPCE